MQTDMHNYMNLHKVACKFETRYLLNTLVTLEDEITLNFINLWDHFRMNNPISLAKYPSIDHIKARNKGVVVDQGVYNEVFPIFEKLITDPHNHKMLQVFSNNPKQDILLISCKEDDISPFLIAICNADKIDAIRNKLDLDCKTFFSINIVNLDGPYDQDPDRQVIADVVLN